MLEIMPLNDNVFRRHICSDLKTDYIPDSFAYFAKCGKRVLALCQFTMSGENADILSLSVIENEPHASMHTASLLISGVLNFLATRGINTVTYSDDSTFAEGLRGFRRRENGSYYTEINGFFDRTNGNETD